MPTRMFSQSDLVEVLGARLNAAAGSAPCALILGAGFSHPLVPTTAAIVRTHLPWYLWCQQSTSTRPCPDVDDPVNGAAAHPDFAAYAVRFWRALLEAVHKHKLHRTLGFRLADDGLPVPDDAAKAYQAAFMQFPPALGSPAMAREFIAQLTRAAGHKVNGAHLYLASLVSTYRAMFRTLITTNFDPHLQWALQLHHVPYFVSDRPDAFDALIDDPLTDATHLVYAHGSVYRYCMLNAKSAIAAHAHDNHVKFFQYFSDHPVVIIGYGGWNDVLTQALATIKEFRSHLYWCDLQTAADEQGWTGIRRRIMRKKGAYFVPIAGAESLLQALHVHAIGTSLPRVFADPVSLVRGAFHDTVCSHASNTLSRSPSLTDRDAARAAASQSTPAHAGGHGLNTTQEPMSMMFMAQRFKDAEALWRHDPPAGWTVLAGLSPTHTQVSTLGLLARALADTGELTAALPLAELVLSLRSVMDPLRTEMELVRARGLIAFGREADGRARLQLLIHSENTPPSIKDAAAEVLNQVAKLVQPLPPLRDTELGDRGRLNDLSAEMSLVPYLSDPASRAAYATPEELANHDRNVRLLKAWSFVQRAEAHNAIPILDELIASEQTPAAQKALALLTRAGALCAVLPPRKGDAIADYERVLRLKAAPPRCVARAQEELRRAAPSP